MIPALFTRFSATAVFLGLMVGVSRDADGAPPAKKLIEYGWDVPTPAQMETNLAAMEKRPFDGIIFQFAGGFNAFSTNLLDPAKFAEDTRILHRLKFTRFTDNFALIWGSPPPGFDWFDDTQWLNIGANAKLLAGVAQAGHVKGICFDPEPYDFRLWNYSEQPRAATHTFAEYRKKVRQRGAQLMHAFETRMPGPTILSFFHVSMFDKFATLPEAEQEEKLSKDKWGLMPDFFIGMLEAASPGTRFIDGNENSYYYTTSEQCFRAYQTIHQRATGLLPPELREKYKRQVEAGQALYVDHDFALRQPNTGKYLSYRMTNEDQAKWFEHNTYWALYSTDEYVWLYSERMNWWKNQTPPGLEEAVLSARQKIADSQPLGFDIAPIIKKAEDAGKK
ncbi:MAG TPA: hypothetical protein VGO67_22955 [Verrucomicrobiae bacterium]|jgi:hypothetical protein